jgi:steroid delta-isomerase-like uncharacterized protein
MGILRRGPSMQRYTAIPLAAGLVFAGLACASENKLTAPTPPVDWQSLAAPPARPAGAVPRITAQERAIADRYLAALASPQCEKVASLLDEAAHFSFAGQETLGPAAVVRHHADVFAAFAPRNFRVTRLWITASEQAIEWIMTGTQAGTWLGLPASARSVVIRGLSLVGTSDDGLIAEIRMYFDQAVVKGQLGVGPAELLALPPPAASDAPPLVVEEPVADHDATNTGVMRMMLQDLEDKKESDFLATLADGIQVFTQDRAEPMTGKDAARGYYKTLHRAIRQLDTVIENAWDVGQFAVVEYSITGVQRGPLGRIQLVPDRALNLRFTDIAELHDGKITRIWRYDGLGALASP